MENLTDRQVELILSLLVTYCFVARYFDFVNYKIFKFYGREYIILDEDYNKVCEIIDYIKGAKNNES